MLTAFRSAKYWSTASFYVKNYSMWGFNILNERSLHENYYRMSYCYKREIICVDVGLGSWGGEPNIRQRVRKSKDSSKF